MVKHNTGTARIRNIPPFHVMALLEEERLGADAQRLCLDMREKAGGEFTPGMDFGH